MDRELSLFYKAKSIWSNQTERLENELYLARKELEGYERDMERGIFPSTEEYKIRSNRLKQASLRDMECFEKDLQNIYDLMNMAKDPEVRNNISLIYKEMQIRINKSTGKQ